MKRLLSAAAAANSATGRELHIQESASISLKTRCPEPIKW